MAGHNNKGRTKIPISGQVHRSKATATGVAIRPKKTALRLMTGKGVGKVTQY